MFPPTHIPSYSGLIPNYPLAATPVVAAPDLASMPTPATPPAPSGMARAQDSSARIRIMNLMNPLTAPPTPAPAPTEYGTPPSTPRLISQREAAVTHFSNRHLHSFEKAALADVKRSVEAHQGHTPASQVVRLSGDTPEGTGHHFTQLFEAGVSEANACFEGLSNSDFPYFYRAQVASHCILRRLNQVDFVDANGRPNAQVNADGSPARDPSGRYINRKLGEAPGNLEVTRETSRASTRPHELEKRQITALVADYVATVYRFSDGNHRTGQLKKSILNKTLNRWAEKILAISHRHGPQMLALMTKAFDSEAAISQENPDPKKQKDDRKHAYRIRNGLADVLAACRPEQREQLFRTVTHQPIYQAAVLDIHKTALADARANDDGSSAYKQIRAGIRFGLNCLLEAPYEVPAPSAAPILATPTLTSMGQWMMGQAASPPPKP
jgi:hypothetical protein